MPANSCYYLCCQSEHGILFDLFHAADSHDQKISERKIHNGLSIAEKQYKNSIVLIFYTAFNIVLRVIMIYYDWKKRIEWGSSFKWELITS